MTDRKNILSILRGFFFRTGLKDWCRSWGAELRSVFGHEYFFMLRMQTLLASSTGSRCSRFIQGGLPCTTQRFGVLLSIIVAPPSPIRQIFLMFPRRTNRSRPFLHYYYYYYLQGSVRPEEQHFLQSSQSLCLRSAVVGRISKSTIGSRREGLYEKLIVRAGKDYETCFFCLL